MNINDIRHLICEMIIKICESDNPSKEKIDQLEMIKLYIDAWSEKINEVNNDKN